MYKMLIVDDEYYIREGMKKIIDWNAIGIEIVGTAENGIQGVEKSKELEPDIILTDIRMKAMDGLAMIDALRAENIHSKFIIMSGYKVFEYAKKALEEGVDFYLLKPVSKQELQDAVQKIKCLLDKEKEDHLSKKLLESEKRIKKWMGLEETGKSIDLSVSPSIVNNYIVIRFVFVPSISFTSTEKLEVYYQLLELRKNIFVFFRNESELIMLLYDDISAETAVKKVRLTLMEKLNRKVFAGISSLHVQPKEFTYAYDEAGKSLQYILYFSDCPVIHYHDIEKYNKGLDPEYVDFRKEIIHSVEICSRDKATEELKKASERIEKCRYYPEEVWNWFKHLYLDLENTLKQSNIEILENAEKQQINKAFQEMNKCTLAELTSMLLELCLQCITAIENSRRGSISRKIKDVVVYIDNHYTEYLSLEQLEAMFYMEFSYISKLFKKEMGVTYLQYITEKRIMKAKELMANPELTLYQIADGVGYTDAKYFSQLFKKLEGMTPKEYREGKQNR